MQKIKELITNFSQQDFTNKVKILGKKTSFLGFGFDNSSLDNVLLWRRFFKPSSFFGHLIAKNVSIVSDFRGLQDIWVTDSLGVCKNDMDDLDTTIRINNAIKNNEPILSFFGGSTIQGVGSFIPNFTIPALVEKILHSEYGIKCICINHGVAGWSSSEQLNSLLHKMTYKPTHCIFYDGWNCSWNYYNGILINEQKKIPSPINWELGTSLRHVEYDYLNSLNFSSSWHFKKGINLFVNKLLTSIKSIVRDSRLTDYLANSYFQIGRLNIFQNTISKSLPDGVRDSYLKQAANEYHRIDKLAQVVCKSRGIKFVHFMQPTLQTINRPLTDKEKGLLEIGESSPNPEVFELFPEFVRRSGLPDHLIDITNTFDSISEDVFVDDGHLNPMGNYYVARRIVKEFFDKQIIQSC
jgi:hypothetical protein